MRIEPFQYIISIFLTFFIVSCKEVPKNDIKEVITMEDSNYFKIAFYDQYKHQTVTESDTIYILKSSNSKCLEYLFFINKHDAYPFFNLKMKNINDSIVTIYDIECQLINSKEYLINQDTFLVKKFFLDEPGSVDEESSFFYCDKYGILVNYNDGWKSLIWTIRNDIISTSIIDSILNDESGFFVPKRAEIVIPPDIDNE